MSMTMHPDKQLYELLQRIEGCGYFDRPASENGDDEASVMLCHRYPFDVTMTTGVTGGGCGR